MIAIDTETTLASNAEPVPRLVSIAVSRGRETSLVHHTDPSAPALVRQVYETGAVLANAPFDAAVLVRWRPELLGPIVRAYQAGRVADVLTREKLIDIAEDQHFARGRYGLGDVAERRAGIQLDKNDPWRTRYELLIDIPIAQWPTEARAYAEADAAATWAVYYAQEASHAALFRPAAALARRHVALWAQTLQGIATDPARVLELDRRLRAEIAAYERELVTAGLARWQGQKSPKLVGDTKATQARMVEFCTARGVPIQTTPTGVPSLSEETLMRAGVPDDHPLGVARLRKARRAMATKVLPVLARPRIRTRYDECIDTARTSASAPQGDRSADECEAWEWVGTNLQNQQQKGGFRECLRADPGHVLVISDFAGAELVTHAQNQLDLFGRSALADVLRSGRNPHTETALGFLGASAYDPEDPEHVAMRQVAKKWNFGRWGGMGDAKFARILFRDMRLDWSVERVSAYNSMWKRQWDADDYFSWVRSFPARLRIAQDGTDRSVRDMTHWRSGFTKGGCTYTEACNFPFQHLAAMGAGEALWQLWCAQQGTPFRQVLFVHDEIVTQAPRELAEVAQAQQESIMVAAFGQWCPDVPIAVETRISECYSK